MKIFERIFRGSIRKFWFLLIFYLCSVILEIIVEIWIEGFFYLESEKFEKSFLNFYIRLLLSRVCEFYIFCAFGLIFFVFGKWEFIVNIMKSICWKFLDYAWVGRRNFLMFRFILIIDVSDENIVINMCFVMKINNFFISLFFMEYKFFD